MTITKEYDYGGLFQVEVCQNCFSYRFNHDPNLVFHGIGVDHLQNQPAPMIEPKGEPEAQFYRIYIPRRAVHLAHLPFVGLDSDTDDIYFAFNADQLKQTHPEIVYMNRRIWENLSNHTHLQSKRQLKKMSRGLFVPDYDANLPTEILLPYLDTSLALRVIAKNQEAAKKAKRFAGKDLEVILFQDGQKFWDDSLKYKEIECPECKSN